MTKCHDATTVCNHRYPKCHKKLYLLDFVMTKGLFNLKEITENSIILLFVYPTFSEVTGRCSIIKIAFKCSPIHRKTPASVSLFK